MRFGTRAALLLGKAIGSTSRALNAGGGSTLPGRVARRIYPGFVPSMVNELPLGCILVTGTNGKTTTSTLLASILDRAGMTPVHNRTGANLMAGIASALIRESDLSGKLAARIGLFEVDEAALPAAITDTSPRLVLVNNLFRDQLDRYGELDTLAAKMKKGVATLDPAAVVALNADDPLVASIGAGLEQKVMYYGIDDERYASGTMQHATDSKHCPACGGRLNYDYYLFGHLGRYECPACGARRPDAEVAATEVEMLGMEGTRCTLRFPGGTTELVIPLPGLYNVYNILAAMTASLASGVEPDIVISAVEEFTAAFGRVERVQVAGREILMILAKNPAGFNEVIRTLTFGEGRKSVMLALNDNIADGRDVSWIWDVDFEMFRGRIDEVVCSGIRAWDMAVRVKYAELMESALATQPDLERALDLGLDMVAPGETLYVVPTYTAMLDLRRVMVERGLVAPFWEGK
ncbi:MAG: MurT ligase domain-containing protein [Candidatus Geothermincolia bacterium]